MKAIIAEQNPPPHSVIFYCAAQDEIDLTSIEMMKGLVKELHGRRIATYATEVHAPVLQRARRANLLSELGEDHVFLTLDAAVRHVEASVRMRE